MSSDAEMTPVKRKGGASSKADSKKSRKQKEPSPEEVDEQDEEEYEIEEVLDCRLGMFAPDRWAFFVKWKNYGEADNSWVDEPDFFAKDMITAWWLAHPEIPGNPLTNKKAKGRKSAGRASSKAKSSVAAAVSDEEDDARSTSKRKSTVNSKKRASEEIDDAATPEEVSEQEDEPQRPKKKSRTATSSTKKQRSPDVEAENGFFDGAADDELGEHREGAMDKHMGKKSWERLVKSIETVERQRDGTLLVYYTSTDGARAISNSSVLAEKAPQRLIAFYESHLRWRGA